MRCLHAIALAAALAAGPPPVAAAQAGDTWWNPAWAYRKRVRVALPAIDPPLPFAYRPAGKGDETVPARASIFCEAPPKTSAANEIRVLDAGGNLLPCVASGPDARGYVHVTFPARRTIVGTIVEAMTAKTRQVTLTCGRRSAVTPGLRFWAVNGPTRVAALEVTAVADKTATARVVELRAPSVAKGTAVRSRDLTAAEYFIYYGNPESREAGPTWTPVATPVAQYTWRVGSAPKSEEQFRDLLTGGPEFVGATRRGSINSSANPLGAPGEGYLLNAYESYVHCPFDGLYRFSIDTDGPSLLYADGQYVAIRPGFFIRSRQWEHRGKIKLSAGYHQLLLLATESSSGGVVTRLGWQPIEAKVYSLVPTSFFASRIQAEVVELATRDKGRQAFFTHRLAARTLVAGEDRRYQFVQFTSRWAPPAASRRDVAYLWSFGDDEQGQAESPGHLYAVGKGEASFTVALTARAGGKTLGTYTRKVHCDPRPVEKLKLALQTVSFANIVYNDERMSMAVRIDNASRSPVILSAVARVVRTRDGKKHVDPVLRRQILIRAVDEDFCIVPVDMKKLPGKEADIEVDLYLGGQKVLGTAARVIPSPVGLETLKPGLGALFDPEGRRVMLCADIEDPERHLKWPILRFIRDDVYAPAAGTRTSILLFGDRMTNLVAPGETVADYVTLIGQALSKQKRAFQFAPRSTGRLPTLPDLVLFAKTLKALKTLPHIIVISPGLADVEADVGTRDFARAVDVMIDRTRAADPRIKIVVVSPPPYPGNRRRSDLYTTKLHRVAKDHHVAFVNLADLLGRDEGWDVRYYAAPRGAAGILLRNPNPAAHRVLADAILEELR